MIEKIEVQLADIYNQMSILSEQYRESFSALSAQELKLKQALIYATPASPEVQAVLTDAAKS